MQQQYYQRINKQHSQHNNLWTWLCTN